MTSNSELEKIALSIKGARILVIGDLMLDTYLIGEAERISPEAPVPVVKLDRREDRLGGAANCAKNIAALGGEPVMMGAIGRKEAGERFLNIVHENDFEDAGILLHDYFLTTRKVRVVAEGQQIVRIDEEEKLHMSEGYWRKAMAFLEKTLPTVGAIAVSDYAKGFITGELMTTLHDMSRMQKIPILVDPKPVNAALYRGCDLMKPNRKEASELGGIEIADDESCDRAAAIVMEKYSPHALLVTRGADGMHLYREDSDPVRIRTHVSHVFDVSGAGDTVLATLAMAMSRGIDMVPACELACHAAAVTVRKPGTSTVSPEELIESIHSTS